MRQLLLLKQQSSVIKFQFLYPLHQLHSPIQTIWSIINLFIDDKLRRKDVTSACDALNGIKFLHQNAPIRNILMSTPFYYLSNFTSLYITGSTSPHVRTRGTYLSTLFYLYLIRKRSGCNICFSFTR